MPGIVVMMIIKNQRLHHNQQQKFDTIAMRKVLGTAHIQLVKKNTAILFQHIVLDAADGRCNENYRHVIKMFSKIQRSGNPFIVFVLHAFLMLV